MSVPTVPPSPVTRLAAVLAHFAGVEPEGDGWYTAWCPVHGGSFPPLRVREDARGDVLLRCPKGCRTADVLGAAGLHPSDLRAPRATPPASPATPAAAGAPVREPGMEPGQLDGEPSRFRVRTVAEMLSLPPLRWLVGGMLPSACLAALVGAPAAGKSFAALDLACSLAAGRPWLSRPTERGGVLYVLAEGAPGMARRLRAWQLGHGVEEEALAPLGFVTEAANLTDATDVVHIVRAAATLPLPPVLIILDTLARSMPGADENSARDVGLVLEHADRIRRATGATVLLVHHSKKDSDVERGSTAFRGALDTLLVLRGEDNPRELVCDKQKDAAPFAPVSLELRDVVLDADGRTRSCVIAPALPSVPGAPLELTPRRRDALRALASFRDAGALSTEWHRATRMQESTFQDVRGKLVEGGLVESVERGKSHRYRITALGRQTLDAALYREASGEDSNSSNTPPVTYSNGRAAHSPPLSDNPPRGLSREGAGVGRRPAARASSSNSASTSNGGSTREAGSYQPEPPLELYDAVIGEEAP